MRRMRSILLILTMISLITLVFAGCSSKGNNSTPSTVVSSTEAPAGTPTETPAAETPKSKPVEAAKVSMIFPVINKAAYKQFIERFNENNEDVQIEPIWGGDQVALIAANNAPDLLQTGDLYIASDKNILLDLSPYLSLNESDLNVSDFYPQLLEPLQADGKQLALPKSFNVGLLYYNKKLFTEAGVEFPTDAWTMEDFIAAGKKLTKTEGKKVTQWGSSSVFGWWGEWLIDVRQAGGDFMTGDKVSLDTPEAINGLQYFLDKTTVGKYKFAPGPKDDGLGGFGGQKTAMEYGGHTGLWLGYNQIADFDWDIQVLPKGLVKSQGAEMALDGYGINKNSKNPDAAWKVLKYITGEIGEGLLMDLGTIPSRKSVIDKALAVPKAERAKPQNLEALVKGLETGMILPRNKNFVNAAIQVVQPNIDKMLEGKMTPAEAGKEATVKAQEFLDQNK